MPDFGHQLQFATFPEPKDHPAHHAVQLALRSEQWGYDLVAFQDHPYIGHYLDIWTLMSWVAARTTRIRVASNVINLGMRSPALTAKSAATIDLLSSGRFELGVGAGNYWDAMADMGIRRLSHGQAINALAEALDVITGSWDTRQPEGLRLNGDHHSMPALRRGPAPAHRIPIWIGAYKPRMLALVGRRGDAWTAALGRIQTRAQWQAASALIDDAATAAGREPADIRRIAGITGEFSSRGTGFLHGPTTQWVDQLLPSVLEDGVDTFLMATDNQRTLQQFAAQVAPALREAVHAERPHRPPETTAPPPRPKDLSTHAEPPR